MIHQIRIEDYLGYGGLTIILKYNGDTLFTGPMVDQVALCGLLRKTRGLDMPLLSGNRVKPGQTDALEFKR